MTTLLLVHGGLWEAGMDADRFWGQPGIVASLEKRGFDVLAPDRLQQAPDWAAEASHLASALPGRPVTVLAGSNGCSAATRLAVDFPDAVAALLLAWPATAKDPAVDAHDRRRLAELGAPDEVIRASSRTPNSTISPGSAWVGSPPSVRTGSLTWCLRHSATTPSTTPSMWAACG